MNSAGRISWISRGEIGSPLVTSYGSERLADYIITVRGAVTASTWHDRGVVLIVGYPSRVDRSGFRLNADAVVDGG
jgi:hypothetical protein